MNKTQRLIAEIIEHDDFNLMIVKLRFWSGKVSDYLIGGVYTLSLISDSQISGKVQIPQPLEMEKQV